MLTGLPPGAAVSESCEPAKKSGKAARTASDGCITAMKAETASCSWGQWQRNSERQHHLVELAPKWQL